MTYQGYTITRSRDASGLEAVKGETRLWAPNYAGIIYEINTKLIQRRIDEQEKKP